MLYVLEVIRLFVSLKGKVEEDERCHIHEDREENVEEERNGIFTCEKVEPNVDHRKHTLNFRFKVLLGLSLFGVLIGKIHILLISFDASISTQHHAIRLRDNCLIDVAQLNHRADGVYQPLKLAQQCTCLGS